ncbi:MAG: ABC transporter ATP-binding protein/permease [Actinomycetia bacterium]|nr:ABC transporter ATP-binding protein/permease [Actinomycetes bacterium]
MSLFPPVVHAYESPTRRDVRTPGEAVTDSPTRFLFWLLGKQAGLIVGGTFFGLIWFLPGTLSPYLLGRAIDLGVTQLDMPATLTWAGLLLFVIVAGVSCDVLASVFQISSWLDALYRITKLVARKVTQMNHVISRRVPAGEMLSVASSDSDTFGALAEVSGRALAALGSFAFVTVLVLHESTVLGLVVLISAPVILGLSVPMMVPMQHNQRVERERSSVLTGMAVDIVSGLRILRGVGGERTFGDNYARQSQSVRRAGVRAGYWWAGIQSLSTVFTGLLLVLLTWLGVRAMLAGDLTVGQLISFFGYAVFLQRPFNTFFEFIQKWVSATVSARKTANLLREEPPWRSPEDPRPWNLGPIADETSGFVAEPGRLTIIVAALPDESAALADRLGRYLPTSSGPVESAHEDTPARGRAGRAEARAKLAERAAMAARDEARANRHWGVSVGGVDLAQIPLADLRQHLVVVDAGAQVFAGTLQELVDPHADHTREQAEHALWTASADDVWEALPEGWQGRIDERGRGLSGGQRQRLVLARSLLLDPDVLVLVEPTSAVDAHTEARIAERLPAARAGRTTILTTVSPLWLRHADRVVLLEDGRVVAAGTHAELMASDPAYRAVVVRGEDTVPPQATPPDHPDQSSRHVFADLWEGATTRD